ncbi:hypothetical protein Ndes2526B_g07276 [Nannochloris sp. 'desiccata']
MKKLLKLLKGGSNETFSPPAAPSTSPSGTRKLNAQLSSKVRNPSIMPGSFFARDQQFKEHSARGGTKAIVQPMTQGPVEFKEGKFTSWTPAWARIEGASIVLYPPQQPEVQHTAASTEDSANGGSKGDKNIISNSLSTTTEKQLYKPQGPPLKKVQLVGSHVTALKPPQEFTISEGAPGGGGGSVPSVPSHGASISIKAGTAGERDQWMVAFGRIPGIFRKAEDYYVFGRKWGHGATSEVIEVVGKFTLKKFALKRRLQNTREATTAMHNELRILQICAKHPHPAIPTLEDFFFSTSGRIELVMQLMQGGELFDWIANREEHLTETDAKIVFRQVVSGIAHLHSLGIAHRDLKPQNLMYVTASEGAGEGAMIKIMDYDLARVNYSPEWEGSTPCGTIHYMAPEVIRRQKYSLAIDCWSLGVLLYILLSGCMPFSGIDDVAIESAIEKGEYSLTGKSWDEVSDEAKDLVKSLLKMEASERLTAAQCLEHPWLQEVVGREASGAGAADTGGVLGGGAPSSPAITIGGKRSGQLSSPERSLRTVQNLRQLSETLRGSSSGGLGGGSTGSADGDLQKQVGVSPSSSPTLLSRSPLSKALDYNLDAVRKHASALGIKKETLSDGNNEDREMKKNDYRDKDSADVTNLRLTLDLVGTQGGILDSQVARATGAGEGLVQLPASPSTLNAVAAGVGRTRDEFADLDAAFVEEEEHHMHKDLEEED